MLRYLVLAALIGCGAKRTPTPLEECRARAPSGMKVAVAALIVPLDEEDEPEVWCAYMPVKANRYRDMFVPKGKYGPRL